MVTGSHDPPGYSSIDNPFWDDDMENAAMEDDITPEDQDPDCPTIVLSAEEKERIRKPWKDAIIIKVLDKQLGYMYLRRKLQQKWSPKGPFLMSDTGNDFYVVKFANQEDLSFVLTQGPWLVGDSYLPIQRWRPNFISNEEKLRFVAAWIRIPNLSMEYFDSGVLSMIGKHVGKVLKIDKTTMMGGKRIGHNTEKCPEDHPTRADERSEEERALDERVIWNVQHPEYNCKYGNWMILEPPMKKFPPPGMGNGNGKYMGSNSISMGKSPTETTTGDGFTVQGGRRGGRTGSGPKVGPIQNSAITAIANKDGVSRFSILADMETGDSSRKEGLEGVTDIPTTNQGSLLVSDDSSVSKKGLADNATKRKSEKKKSGKSGNKKIENQKDTQKESNMERPMMLVKEDKLKEAKNPNPKIQQRKTPWFLPPISVTPQSGSSPASLAGHLSLDQAEPPDCSDGNMELDEQEQNSNDNDDGSIDTSMEDEGSETPRAEVVGFRGGIWAMWRKEIVELVQVDIQQQVVSLEVRRGNEDRWIFSAIYASPTPADREEVWNRLLDLKSSVNCPWLLMGDYDETASLEERIGSSDGMRRLSDQFLIFLRYSSYFLNATTKLLNSGLWPRFFFFLCSAEGANPIGLACGAYGAAPIKGAPIVAAKSIAFFKSAIIFFVKSVKSTANPSVTSSISTSAIEATTS
ncbi:hypothetical protein V2J09_021482 [Rumex salicifolius]